MRIRATPTISSILVFPLGVSAPIIAMSAAVWWKNPGEWEMLAIGFILPSWLIADMLGRSLELHDGYLLYRRWFITVFETRLIDITGVCFVSTLKEALATASLPGRMHLEYCDEAGEYRYREIIVEPFRLKDIQAIQSAIEAAIAAKGQAGRRIAAKIAGKATRTSQ